jgi:hypothetical protein
LPIIIASLVFTVVVKGRMQSSIITFVLGKVHKIPSEDTSSEVTNSRSAISTIANLQLLLLLQQHWTGHYQKYPQKVVIPLLRAATSSATPLPDLVKLLRASRPCHMYIRHRQFPRVVVTPPPPAVLAPLETSTFWQVRFLSLPANMSNP